jgi:nucleoid DNA-binding protein
MAKAAKKAAGKAKGGSKKPAAKEAVRIRPINEKFTKSGLAKHLSAESGVETRSVKAVLGALENTMFGCLHKKGAGQFTLPGLLRVQSQAVAAKPRRQGKDPFTGQERWFEAKPASVRVRARPLKKLKDAAR